VKGREDCLEQEMVQNDKKTKGMNTEETVSRERRERSHDGESHVVVITRKYRAKTTIKRRSKIGKCHTKRK